MNLGCIDCRLRLLRWVVAVRGFRVKICWEYLWALPFGSFKCLFGCTVQEPSSNLAIHLAQVSVKYRNTTPYNAHQTCETIYESPSESMVTPSSIPFMSERTMPGTGSACLKKCLKLIAKFWEKNMRRNNNRMVCFALDRGEEVLGCSSRLGSLAMANGTFGVSNFLGMVKMSAMARVLPASVVVAGRQN